MQQTPASCALLMGWLICWRSCGHAGRVFPLEQAREAAAESVRSGRGGKVFLAS